MTFQVTAAHQAFFDFLRDPKGGNAILQAVAGSGKTSTSVEAMRVIQEAHPNANVLYVAFNKRVVGDISPRLPSNATASTLHSLGLRAWSVSTFSSRPQVNAKKVSNAFRALGLPSEMHKLYRPCVMALIAAAKALVLVPQQCGLWSALQDDADGWEELIQRFNIAAPGDDDNNLPQAVTLARKLLIDGIENSRVFDFDDMLYMPVVKQAGFAPFDFVFVDEAQDLNPVQRIMVGRLMAHGGRLVVIGDPRQAIYGWRGADHDAMDRLEQDHNCQTFHLDVSYRVARCLEERVQAMVPHFRCHEANAEGSVEDCAGPLPYNAFKAKDLVLCRNNAPLVKTAFHLIRHGVACQVLGKEIGEGLAGLVRNLKAKTLVDLSGKLDVYETAQRERLKAKKLDKAIDFLEDRCSVLRLFIERASDVDGLIDDLVSFFQPDNKAGRILTLSTIHKAKGGEADNVWLLDADLIPSRYAERPEELLQEENLRYVAYTRAKQTLKFIRSPAEQQDEGEDEEVAA